MIRQVVTKSEAKRQIRVMVASNGGGYLGPFEYIIEVSATLAMPMGIHFDPETDEFTYFDHSGMSETKGNRVVI